jgi:hypothetical protein
MTFQVNREEALKRAKKGKSQFIYFSFSDGSKRFIGSEYSTEKVNKLIRCELGSLSSKRESLQNSASESLKYKKDDYAMYIDRPFNSINGIVGDIINFRVIQETARR